MKDTSSTMSNTTFLHCCSNRLNASPDNSFFQDAFGMTASKPLDQNGYAPKSPPGSKLMSFGEVKETLGILLQPSQAVEDPAAARKMGEAFAGVCFVVGGGDENVTSVDRRVASALETGLSGRVWQGSWVARRSLAP